MSDKVPNEAVKGGQNYPNYLDVPPSAAATPGEQGVSSAPQAPPPVSTGDGGKASAETK